MEFSPLSQRFLKSPITVWNAKSIKLLKRAEYVEVMKEIINAFGVASSRVRRTTWKMRLNDIADTRQFHRRKDYHMF